MASPLSGRGLHASVGSVGGLVLPLSYHPTMFHMLGIPRASAQRPWPLVAVPGEDSAEVINDWPDGEEIAAAWVRRFGWADAEATPAGHDNGIDVWAKGAVAQVKCWKQKKVGIKYVQRLAGTAKPAQSCIFFSTTGYTKAALLWTYHPDHRVALFQLLPDGRLIACNWHAWRIAQQAPLRFPYAFRRPRPRALYVCLGIFFVFDGVFLLWLTALSLMRGAYATATGANFTFMIGTMGIASIWIVAHTLGPEAHRFMLAARRYKETRSWADWRGAFKVVPADRDAGTPPDLFVGYEVHWLVRLLFFGEDLGRWWRFTRRWVVCRWHRGHRP